MLRVCVAVAMAGLGLAATSIVSPAASQSFIERSAACVTLMRKLDRGTPIRAGLNDNSCPLEKSAVAFTGKPRAEWLESGAACRQGPAETPVPMLPKCGLETELTDTLADGLVRIDLGGGRCLNVAPVMLTDKVSGFSCNAMKARSACLLGVRKEGDRTIVTLASGRDRKAAKAEIVIPARVERSTPLAMRSRQGPLFALMPNSYTYRGEQVDALGYVARQVEASLASCTDGHRRCREQADHVADLHLQQVLRRVWNPRSLVADADRTREREAFLAAIRTADLGDHAADKRLFTRIITRNEIGGESPYQVLDAVIRNSSLSWGAHQIDIGANPQPEIDLFWRTLAAWRRAPGTGDYPHLRSADRYRACLSQPMRSYFTSHMALMWNAMPDITKGMRAAQSQAAYRAHYVKWLDAELKPAMRLGGLFKVSAFARHYYLDQTNQRGTKASTLLREAGEAVPAEALATCAGVAAAEQKLVETIKCNYLAGQCNEPPAGRDDIERRASNLSAMLTEEFGAGQGRVCK